MVDNKIVYSVKIASDGKDYNSNHPVIEFFVDHVAEAVCKYDSEVTLENNFWVNQEDVEAHKRQVFTCQRLLVTNKCYFTLPCRLSKMSTN